MRQRVLLLQLLLQLLELVECGRPLAGVDFLVARFASEIVDEAEEVVGERLGLARRRPRRRAGRRVGAARPVAVGNEDPARLVRTLAR